MPQALTDNQRRLIHDLALEGRTLLTREARELLEGTFGLYANGRLDPADKLPEVQSDPETGETYRRLAQFLADEARAGLPRPEAVEKLVKEVAFTHLNRLVAFKMMEARKLIRGTVDKGLDSNAFKFYLADPAHAEDYARFQQGQADAAYRHFLLWQAGQVAREVRVLFDPDTLPSRLFPRPRAMQTLIEMLNKPELAPCWQADETIGWLYQFFNEEEKAQVFERLYKKKQKIRRQDLPAATQLFTPHWIVRFLVQNTLGRLWVQMHPDTRLLGTELLDYLVPIPRGAESTTTDRRLETEDAPIQKSLISNLQSPSSVPREPLRPIAQVTLLDPACGTMHFGLVAFDLFAAMYQEELERAGEPGWLDAPSVSDPAGIPAAIIKNNLFGIDIDLRAVQLSALALYLKAKALNKKASITDSNLACADVLPFNGARLGAFLKETRFERPIYERLIRALWARLKDLNEIGSLLRLEEELEVLIAEERARYEKAPLFAGLPGEFEREAAEEEFWQIISAQIVQGLDEFARRQAAAGHDATFFVGEAAKGLRVLDLMMRRYDVVITNPPYSTKGNINETIASYLDSEYPKGKGDIYAAFILRCAELIQDRGWLGMITQQSFMFISTYKQLRADLSSRFAIETMAHTGPRTFIEITGEKVNTTVFTLRVETATLSREQNIGTYYRLVNAPEGDGKRRAFEHALQSDHNTYRIMQYRFDAIPGSPWAYWVSDTIRDLFNKLPKLADLDPPKEGINTGKNERFIRYSWEIQRQQVLSDYFVFFIKGAPVRNYFDKMDEVLRNDLEQIRLMSGAALRNQDFAFREAVAFLSNATGGFRARLIPAGCMFCSTGGRAVFPNRLPALGILALLNSSLAKYILKLINPTVTFTVGDIGKIPIEAIDQSVLINPASILVRQNYAEVISDETAFDFIAPLHWKTGLEDLAAAQSRLAELEGQIDDEVYRLYGISDEDRAAIEAELAGGGLGGIEDEAEEHESEAEDEDEVAVEAPMTAEGLAVRWVSYAIGVVLGRFQPGQAGTLGSAIYRRSDFAVGSLPEPNEAEFDQLVGPPERFAYVDEQGGRHLFPAEVETALRNLAVPDGITVLDEGHPRDLPALVEKALALMLDATYDDGPSTTEHAPHAAEVIQLGAGGDLRKFLEKDYFTRWHVTNSWYRKRPVYWPLQSAKRSYGFVIFHERVNQSTLYVLQREYLDHKLNGLRLRIDDLRSQLESQSGAVRKRTEREIDKTGQQLDEIAEFAQTIDRLVREGYEPEENWIDDGVILRLAPLWELIPIWKTEPKKYWERLQNGDFDWSHIAMHYWSERVKEKCKTNKSFAIAHGRSPE